jgi:hypothetical protein
VKWKLGDHQLLLSAACFSFDQRPCFIDCGLTTLLGSKAMPEFARDFPSRRYPLPRTASLSPEGFESIQAPPPPLAPGAIYRCVRGVDPLPGIRMSAAKIQTHLRDPFAELLLKRGIFPLSLRELLARLDEHNDAAEGLPEQKSFLVADGGKIHWTAATQELNRFFRLAVGRARNDDYKILISSSVALDSTDSQAFLQVIGWDAIVARARSRQSRTRAI